MPAIHILHINDARGWRGGEAQTFMLAAGLHDRGDLSVLAVQPGSTLEAKAQERGIPAFSLRMRGELDLRAVWRIRRYVAANRIEIVHTHTGHAHSLAALALLLMPRVRLVVHRRVDFHRGRGLLSRIKYLARPDAYIAISRAIRTILLEDGVAADRIHLIPSGIDLSRFDNLAPSRSAVRTEIGFAESCILCGNVAALAPHKAQWDLLAAAEIVVKKMPEVRFVIVGEGEMESLLRKMCEEKGLGRYVVFAGFRNDVPRILAALDVFVLSSRTEGLGTSVLEAMGAGVAVAATSAGGIPEMVEHEKNGLLSPPQDPGALADNLIRLCGDEALRRRLAEAGRETVRRFDVRTTVSSIRAVYEALTVCGRAQ